LLPLYAAQPVSSPSPNKITSGMICVECRRPVVTLYTEYSKGNIRLTQCVCSAAYWEDGAGAPYSSSPMTPLIGAL
jgi:hypothetical protein